MQDPGWLGKRDGQSPAAWFYPQPSSANAPQAWCIFVCTRIFKGIPRFSTVNDVVHPKVFEISYDF